MIGDFLRTNQIVSYMLTVIRIWLGYSWTMSGWNKLTTDFSAQSFIKQAIDQPVTTPTGEAFPWFTLFLKATTSNGNHTEFFSFVVPWGEFLVGLGLIFGVLSLWAAFFGLLMNFTYLFSGAISNNPLFIIAEFLMLSGGLNTTKIGLEAWIKNYINPPLQRPKYDFQDRQLK